MSDSKLYRVKQIMETHHNSETTATRRFHRIQSFLSSTSHGSTDVSQRASVAHVDQNLNVECQQESCEDDDVQYPLTREEAISFLKNNLGIDEPEQLLERDRLEFLDTFIYRMNVKIPFTNMNVVARHNLTSITCPTLQEGKESILKSYGGPCIYINMFTKAVLDVMGFQTFHIGANNPGEALFDTHISTIVRNLTYPGSQHLVDPGMVRPLYEPIPLDFEEESPVYEFNYMKVKFFKKDHGILLLCSQVVPEPQMPSPNIFKQGGCFWKLEITFRLHVPRTRRYWLERMKCRYRFPTLVPHAFVDFGMFGQLGDTCVTIGYTKGMFGLKYQHVDPNQAEVHILSREEFPETVTRLFPQYPQEMIEKALVTAGYARNLYKL